MSIINEGDIVIIYESNTKLSQIKIHKGDSFQNKFGFFYHDEFIGRPYGSKVLYLTIILIIF